MWPSILTFPCAAASLVLVHCFSGHSCRSDNRLQLTTPNLCCSTPDTRRSYNQPNTETCVRCPCKCMNHP